MKRLSLIALCLLSLGSPLSSYGNQGLSAPNFNNSISTLVNLIYKNGLLSIKGLTGIGTVRLYSIIGNEVAVFNQIDLFDFQRNIPLESKTMYIVRVETMGEVKTYKLVTR